MARVAYVGAIQVDYNYDTSQSDKCWAWANCTLLDDDGTIPTDDTGQQASVTVGFSGGNRDDIRNAITAAIRGRWNDQSIAVTFL